MLFLQQEWSNLLVMHVGVFFPLWHVWRSLHLARLLALFPVTYPQSAGPCSLSGACKLWLLGHCRADMDCLLAGI
ncbi:hypothetical protein HOY82DRAFT_547631 [Tuber indicum]|nr:hypothetical protein HOY82DRAFT_547631 [Tuber indicum]